MKKILVTVPLLLVAVAFCFAQKQGQTPFTLSVTRAVAKAVLEQPNPNASTNAQTIHITIKDTFINVENPLARPYFSPNTIGQDCLAWPLNENWLITSATCGKKAEPSRKDVKVATHKILLTNPDFDFATNNNIMLIWKHNDRSAVSFAAPFTKLLAVNTTTQLFSLQWQNKILVSKGHKTKSTSIEPGYKGQYTCEVTHKSYHPTESLFVLTPQESEFLAAFSNVYYHYNSYGLVIPPSKFFISLTKKDLQFIKETVNDKRPQDWQSIKTRLFYNDIEKPYFE